MQKSDFYLHKSSVQKKLVSPGKKLSARLAGCAKTSYRSRDDSGR